MPVEEFLKVADLLPEAMLLVAADGTVLAANASLADRLGLLPGELTGRPLASLVAGSPEKLADYLRSCSRTRERVYGSLVLSGRDGRPIPCRSDGVVYRPRSGDRPAIVLLRLVPKDAAVNQFIALTQRIEELSREVAQRRRAEEEMRRQREWLQVTLSSIGDAVIATDNHACVVFMNAVAEALTGWSREEAAGQPLEVVFNIVNEETRGQAENPVLRVLREGTVVGLANHTVLVARDSTERPIDDCAAPIRGDGERAIGVVLVFHDVTERRALERELRRRAEQLLEAARRKDEFLAMLAHELRNPLAPVRNSLEVLRLAGDDPATVREVREMMERQVEHLARLIDDLLDVARITRGQIRLQREPVALADVVRRAVEVVGPAARQRRQELIVTAPPAGVLVDADAVRLAQVIQNLLSNAVKFTDPGGRIWLTAEVKGAGHPPGRGREVVVRVRDTGVGIDAAFLPYIFDLFSQADRSLDRTQGGLGVGLTLVKSLVEMHAGSVTAHSEGQGQGSEFIVRLPLAVLEGPIAETGGATERRRQDEGRKVLRVLVIDDNRDSAESLALLLRLLGCEARTAYHGEAALEVGRQRQPDVVLCDIGLPEMDGFEVARRLRRQGETVGAFLVATTGYGRDEDRRLATEAGFDHHLTKPVEPQALRALLAARAGSHGGP